MAAALTAGMPWKGASRARIAKLFSRKPTGAENRSKSILAFSSSVTVLQ
ncbi:hypothetical protein IG631_06157 [Alternaria alternata]|nr:hypothetical protein IG631_06157 [Alternaria alternata]